VHPFKVLYRQRFITRRNWAEKEPERVTFACHANNVVTCLQFDKDKIVSASDDHSINVFETRTGATRARLSGHEGGVWALQYIGKTLVSGSTDRTVRVWDLERARCTHVFVGHTSTVRCLQIVEPENVNPDPHGEPIWEPRFPIIVTGSRDWSLRVWKLPSPDRDSEYHPHVPTSPTEDNTDPTENPYHIKLLSGHRQAVRALAARGRTLVSGSYDCTVRVWDLVTKEVVHVLKGHTQKVYSVVYDPIRKQCASGSMDGTVRLWSTQSGECLASLEGHSSLVGLLGLSYRHLVSAAADSTLRIWDPATGDCRHTLAAHSGAITCFQHDEYKVISGSDGTLKMWDVREGTFTRDLLTGLTGVWQVAFDHRFCVAAVQRNGQSEFEILDFGAVDDIELAEDEPPLVKLEEDEFDSGLGALSGRRASEGPRSRDRNFYHRSSQTTRGLLPAQTDAIESGSTSRFIRRASSSRNLQAVTSTLVPSSSRGGGNRERRPAVSGDALAVEQADGLEPLVEDEAGGEMDVELEDEDRFRQEGEGDAFANW
jgi:F-box and WD-40 domain protein CDC4